MNKSVVLGFQKSIHPEWWTILTGPMRDNFRACLNLFISLNPEVVCPEPTRVFDAFKTAPNAIKVVIIGAEPCSSRSESTGLSYSNQKMTPTLANIAGAIAACTNQQLQSSDLSSWAAQDVLMLNMHLTSTVANRADNRNAFWFCLTSQIIQWIDINVRDVIFVVWGSIITTVKPLIVNSVIKTYTHPSPLCDNRLTEDYKFVNCRHFLDINKSLLARNHTAINWGLAGNVATAAIETIQGGAASYYDATDHVIFTDGGCENNGKVGARASYAAYFARGPYKGRLIVGLVNDTPERAPTNNRAELLAIIEALSAIDDNSTKSIYIISDSKISIGTVNSWLDKWDREGLIDKHANPDFTRRLLLQQKRLLGANFTIKAIYQPAHALKCEIPCESTNPDLYFRYAGNNYVDCCCTAMLKNKPMPEAHKCIV